jgi:hypothetical protein
MILQLNAEVTDDVNQAVATAMYVSRALQMKILFYWDRVAVYVSPNDTTAGVLERINAGKITGAGQEFAAFLGSPDTLAMCQKLSTTKEILMYLASVVEA